MVALYYGVVPTKVRKTPRDLAQTSIYATLHQHRTLRCGGERRRRRVSGAFRTNHRRAMGELYQVKGMGQINLVRTALPFIADKGSFTLVLGAS